jgi:hypothetical protein
MAIKSDSGKVIMKKKESWEDFKGRLNLPVPADLAVSNMFLLH